VTRKITRALARIKIGTQKKLYLGNLDAKRDWGHARDFIEAQWLMLQQETPEDFVIATGKQYSVRDFVEAVAQRLDLPLKWDGSSTNEKGLSNGKAIIEVDPKYFRPTEVETLLGDATKAREKLNWRAKTTFDQLVDEMVTADLKEAEQEKMLNTQ